MSDNDYKNFYKINRWWLHLRNLFWFPLYLLAKIVPKREIIIFGSMNGYAIADNSKYLFQNTYQKGYYWITKNKELLNTQILTDVYPIYAYSLKGLFLQLTAATVYYTHKIDDFLAPLIMGAEIVALWHGVPFKKIGAMEKHETSVSLFKQRIRRIKAFLLPYSYYMYCNKVICPERKFAEIYRQCFSFVKPEILIQQMPRVLYAKKCLKSRKILYAPTYRRYRKLIDVLEKTNILSKHFSDWLKANDIDFVIRPHPIDAGDLFDLSIFSNIKLDVSFDIYETLTSYTAFITDYSSLAYDAEVLGLHCFFLADDVDEYSDENGLFADFVSLLHSKGKSNIVELIPELEHAFEIWKESEHK